MTTVATEPWQHRDIITNGIRMHYVTQGEGPLILLLHGFPEFWYSWRYQIPFLAEHGYTVVAPDLRGYNDTDKPRKGYDVMNAPHPQAMLRELRTLKQLRKSWYMFLFQIPWLPETMLLRNHANEIGRMLRRSAVQKDAFPREVTAKYQEAMSKPGSVTAALNYYRQLFRHPPGPAERISHISIPTLLIWGEQDIALGIELTYGLEQWVDNIQVKRIPDSGHWVQQEQPDKVNQLMLAFLQGRHEL